MADFVRGDDNRRVVLVAACEKLLHHLAAKALPHKRPKPRELASQRGRQIATARTTRKGRERRVQEVVRAQLVEEEVFRREEQLRSQNLQEVDVEGRAPEQSLLAIAEQMRQRLPLLERSERRDPKKEQECELELAQQR
eukprot:CAMPEP_0119364370 /NCGR_PEP_ID=MMETSP1334-20130426/11290_1 /TAXON_ID=127549 /ORGANISM="Calcidiscus leptoporus, Strain RCC1130" /LENGTH=138 /DNA_ID=CAMNT_0007380055 /DNA_START=47 /DNA_END=459 /DNA_ORIENTATION=-